MNFFGVGAGEAALVFVIALLVVGPQRFPEIMRSAGRWYKIARAYSNEVMKDVRAAVDDIEREVRSEVGDLKSLRDLTDVTGDLTQEVREIEEIGQESGFSSARRTKPQTSATPHLEAKMPPRVGAKPPPKYPATRQPIRPSYRAAEQTADADAESAIAANGTNGAASGTAGETDEDSSAS